MGWIGSIYSPKQWHIDEFSHRKNSILRSTIPYWAGEEIFEYIIGWDDDYSQWDISGFFPKLVVQYLQEEKLAVISQSHGSFIIVDKKGIVVWSDFGNVLNIKKHYYDVCCCRDRKDRLCWYCSIFKEKNLNTYIEWDWSVLPKDLK